MIPTSIIVYSLLLNVDNHAKCEFPNMGDLKQSYFCLVIYFLARREFLYLESIYFLMCNYKKCWFLFLFFFLVENVGIIQIEEREVIPT